MAHSCESCSHRYNVYPKTPCKIANNRFFRNFPSVIERPTQFPSYCSPNIDATLPLQLDPLIPAGTNRPPRRKSTKMIGKRSTGCPPKKVLKKRVSKMPTPCISDDADASMHTRSARSVPPSAIPSCQPTIATHTSSKPSNKPPEDSRCASSFHPSSNKSLPHKSVSSKTFTVHSSYVMQNLDGSVVKGEMDAHPGDCGCNECEKNEPCGVNGQDQSDYCGDAASSCTMSKASEKKSISNYLYDNPSLKSTTSKKVSACAEILDCIDDDTELWILQCPKSFDINKVLNTDLSNNRKGASKAIDTCCERFKCPVNLICLAPEKATEYKSVCDQIRLIQPKGKIMVTEQELPAQSDMTCSERDQTDDECSQVGDTTTVASMAESCAQLASKKVQKKLNDQRFTIETTVTVENVDNERSSGKKARKNMQASCSPIAPLEPSPTKRKTKKC